MVGQETHVRKPLRSQGVDGLRRRPWNPAPGPPLVLDAEETLHSRRTE